MKKSPKTRHPLVVVIIVLVVAAGFFALGRYQNKNTKTLVNQDIGYSFDYPADWTSLPDTQIYYPSQVGLVPAKLVDSFAQLRGTDDTQAVWDLPSVTIEATGTSGQDLPEFLRGFYGREAFRPEAAETYVSNEGIKGLLYDGPSQLYNSRTIVFPRPNQEGTLIISSIYIGDALEPESVAVMNQIAQSLHYTK